MLAVALGNLLTGPAAGTIRLRQFPSVASIVHALWDCGFLVVSLLRLGMHRWRPELRGQLLRLLLWVVTAALPWLVTLHLSQRRLLSKDIRHH